MTSLISTAAFKYINRNKQDSLVLIPGWGSDYRIFNSLNLRFNYLVPLDFSPFSFERSLLELIKENNLKNISLFGWSLGGFLAADFASQHPDLTDKLILVSVRREYEKKELFQIRNLVEKSPKAYIYKFYLQCFCQRERMLWFKENFLKSYFETFNLDNLLKGLDYLETAQINPWALKKVKDIKMVHGDADAIAPLEEAIEIRSNLSEVEFICIKDAGHLVFLEEDLGKYI